MRLAALLSLLNGLLAHGALAAMPLPSRPSLLGDALPFGLHRTGRPLSAGFGMLLVYLAYYPLRRQHVAWWLAVVASAVALAAHLLRLGTVPLVLDRGLFAYQEKFESEWEDRFSIYNDGQIGLARISFAVTRLTADR